MGGEDDRDLDRGRVDVVGRLAQVDVLVGVDVVVLALLVAEQLERPIGDDLVGVHVRGSAGAALEHIDHKLIVELASDDFIRMGAMISAAGLPVLVCMEGGYGVPEIGLNVANVLKGLEA